MHMGMHQSSLAQTSWHVVDYQIRFYVKNAGLRVEGSLSGLEAQLVFDVQSGTGKLYGRVPVRSINTGIALRDRHLQEEGYFNAARYPFIEMQSVRIEKRADGQYTADFALSMKGITRLQRIDFFFDGKQFRANFLINRRDFDIGQKSWILSDTVEVSLQVTVR